METIFDALTVSDAAAPEDEEVDHEYQFVPHVTRALRRKMTLGADYHGVNITRAKGLEVTQYTADGTARSRAQLNGDVFAMYDDNGTPRLYFDPETGRYKFVGDLDISGGSINMSGGTINWGENNPADGSGISASQARTIINEVLVSSPTIIGGAYWSYDENTKLDLLDADETEFGIGSGMILYRSGGGMPIFSVSSTVLVTEFRGYNRNEFLKVDALQARPQGKWNFSEADQVTGLYLRFS